MKGRLAPGRIFLVDTEQKRLILDEEAKKQLAARQPYAQWLKENQITLDHLPSPTHVLPTNHDTILMRQRAFGYTDEDLKTILRRRRSRARNPSARWESTRRWLACPTSRSRCSVISSRRSRRLPTRRSIRFAKGW